VSFLLLAVGLLLAIAGSAGATALVTTARAALAEAIARRLRGGDDSLAWLAETERQVAAATAATSLGIALIGVTIPGVLRQLTPTQFTLAVLILVVPATLVGGYLLPRWLTVPRAETVVESLRPVLAAWSQLLGLVMPARLTDPAENVRALAREGAASGLADDELVMVGGVMSFAQRPVRVVMTPRTEVVAVEHDASHDEVMRTFAESGYTRLPVMRGTLDEIVGIVHAFDLFKLGPDDPVPVRPVSLAPESRLAGDLLLDMQRERRHFAVVLDEFGGTAGIVTLEDLLEGLVGEISDEDDGSAPSLRAPGSLLELDGSEPPRLVEEHFGVLLPRGEAASIGGLLGELAGRIPAAGERFAVVGLEVEVLQASPTRVERLLVRRAGTEPVSLDREPR
jgi:CBS domain containing-hemolysin-like protein